MKKQRTTYPEESEEGRDGLMVIGAERLKIVDDYMTAHPIGRSRPKHCWACPFVSPKTCGRLRGRCMSDLVVPRS